MSVYSFGKIVGDALDVLRHRIHDLATASGITVTFGPHEPEDNAVLEESRLLRKEGIVFTLFEPGGSDIGSLWREAFDAGQNAIRFTLGEDKLPRTWEQAQMVGLTKDIFEALLSTRLGQFIDGLFKIPTLKSAGFAIFDNGVDQVVEDSATNCQQAIMRSLLIPWDLGPNALYVWSSDKNQSH